MSSSVTAKEFCGYIVDLMQALGPATAKSMFGGYGIFLDDLMFGLVAGSALYLKADEQSREEFTSRGLAPFTYRKKYRDVQLSYYLAPDEALDDCAEMAVWAGRAYQAAVRTAKKKK